jgi:hypothetical protein
VFDWATTAYVLDRAAIVIGKFIDRTEQSVGQPLVVHRTDSAISSSPPFYILI